MGRFFSIIFALLLLSGCAEERKSASPGRIGSLCTAASAVMCRLGAPPAAVDQYGAFLVPDDVVIIGKGTAIQVEKVLESGIDTLIVWSYQVPAVEHLKRRGIRLVPVEPVRMKNFPELVETLGILTGKEKESRRLIDVYKKQLSLQSAATSLKRVYLELYTRNRGSGDLSYTGDLLRAAGGKSILEKTSLAGSEHIIRSNPEVIFFVEGFTDAKEIMARPGFAAVEAVKRKAVFSVPRRFLVEGAFPVEAVEYFKKRMD